MIFLLLAIGNKIARELRNDYSSDNKYFDNFEPPKPIDLKFDEEN
jgi:hypothetical protein